MKTVDKRDECYKALQCLYIVLDGAVANDVSYKVKAYTVELESQLITAAERERVLVEALEKIVNVIKLWRRDSCITLIPEVEYNTTLKIARAALAAKEV